MRTSSVLKAIIFVFSRRRRHTRSKRDWSSDVCSSDLGGVVTLGRVLTLVIVASGDEAEAAVVAANKASREHPCRVIVVDRGNGRDQAGMDAQIRIGAHAGASDVVVLRPYRDASAEIDTLVMPLLLPDAPIVAWWPSQPPDVLGEDPL